MPRSYAAKMDLSCPTCGESFAPDVWLIVDLQERPDLAESLGQGTLHHFDCPHCGQPLEADLPLLVHDPAHERVIYCPPPGSSEEQDHEYISMLLERLARSFPQGPPEYLTHIYAVPRGALPALLGGEELASAGEAAEESTALPPLMEQLLAFVQAETWQDSQRMVDEHPELLSEQADTWMEKLAGMAYEQGDEQLTAALEEHRVLLQRCREVGVEAAFEEKAGGAEGSAGGGAEGDEERQGE